jgi:hypothetical protein
LTINKDYKLNQTNISGTQIYSEGTLQRLGPNLMVGSQGKEIMDFYQLESDQRKTIISFLYAFIIAERESAY